MCHIEMWDRSWMWDLTRKRRYCHLCRDLIPMLIISCIYTNLKQDLVVSLVNKEDVQWDLYETELERASWTVRSCVCHNTWDVGFVIFYIIGLFCFSPLQCFVTFCDGHVSASLNLCTKERSTRKSVLMVDSQKQVTGCELWQVWTLASVIESKTLSCFWFETL